MWCIHAASLASTMHTQHHAAHLVGVCGALCHLPLAHALVVLALLLLLVVVVLGRAHGCWSGRLEINLGWREGNC